MSISIPQYIQFIEFKMKGTFMELDKSILPVSVEECNDPIIMEHMDKISSGCASIQAPFNSQQKWNETDISNLKNFLRQYYPE